MSGPTYTDWDPDVLRYLYHDQDMTQQELGDIYGVSASTVGRALNHYDIGTSVYDRLDAETIRDQYDDGHSLPELADEHNTVRSTIWKIVHEKIVEDPVSRETLKDELTPDELRTRYINLDQPTQDIAYEYDTNEEAIWQLLHEYGIKTKSVGDYTISADSDTEYPKSELETTTYQEIREQVIERDDECRYCETTDRPLQMHHITPQSDFDDPQDSHRLDNCVLLCDRCHRHAEFGKITIERPDSK